MTQKSKAEVWTRSHDHALVKMYNLGESAADICKALNKMFGTKRTPVKCRSRITRIRSGLKIVFPDMKVQADSETGRNVISWDLVSKWHKAGHPNPPRKAGENTDESPKKKDHKPLNGQTLESDRLMASMYNKGATFDEIAKAVTKKFGVKRTAIQCRSRIGNIRVKAATRGTASKVRAVNGRLRLTDVMLRTYHNMPGAQRRAVSPRRTRKASPKPQAMPEKVVSKQTSKQNGVAEHLKLELGKDILTVSLEGQFAKNEAIRGKAAKFLADIAVNH